MQKASAVVNTGPHDFGLSEDIWWDVCTMYSILKWTAALRSTHFRGQPTTRGWGSCKWVQRISSTPPSHKFWPWKKPTHISRGLPVTWKAWRCTEKYPIPLEKVESKFSEHTDGVWVGNVLQYSLERGIYLPPSTGSNTHSLIRSVRKIKNRSHSLYDFPRNDMTKRNV